MIIPNSPSSSGGTVVSYSVSPALPDGLTLNTSTGVISGTPTALVVTQTTYTVTATNSGGSTTAALKITVKDAAPQISLDSYSYTFTRNLAITPITPTNTGGVVATWSVTPALPAGLSQDSGTGVISGTPTAAQALTGYNISASNSGGTSGLEFDITVSEGAPSGLTYDTSTATYTKGVAIASNYPDSEGGAPTSYSVSPALPSGLTLNTSTGVITGTPGAVAAQASYTVTARNSAGSTTAVLSITVNDAQPSIAFASSSYSFTTGLAIAPLAPASTGGEVVTWAIAPALPAGLSFSTTTGTISGTPTTITASASYQVTATNSGGEDTASAMIAVNPPAPHHQCAAQQPGRDPGRDGQLRSGRFGDRLLELPVVPRRRTHRGRHLGHLRHSGHGPGRQRRAVQRGGQRRLRRQHHQPEGSSDLDRPAFRARGNDDHRAGQAPGGTAAQRHGAPGWRGWHGQHPGDRRAL